MLLLRTLFASLCLLIIGGYTLYIATDDLHAFTSEAARRIAVRQHPVEIPDVELETAAGTRINISELRGKWLVVDFIYTHCQTYCTALGSEFAQLQGRLAEPLARNRLRLLSISFDPARDTPAQLAAYKQRSRSHGQGWLATRPVTLVGLKQLEQTFGIVVIPDLLGGYTHNTAIHIVDPQGRLVNIMDMGRLDHTTAAVLRRLHS